MSNGYSNLNVWNKAYNLTLKIYDITIEIVEYKSSHQQYGYI